MSLIKKLTWRLSPVLSHVHRSHVKAFVELDMEINEVIDREGIEDIVTGKFDELTIFQNYFHRIFYS